MKIRIYDANQRKQVKSGYGLMAYQLAANLKQLGHEICFFPRKGDTEDVALWIRPPHYVKYPEFAKGKKNVFFTMHETEVFEGWKSDWPELLNRCDAVITPTQWNKDVFKKHGVKIPIYVVPLGVNSKDFSGSRPYNFSILTLHDALGKENSRENWKDTLKAYYDAFYGEHHSDVRLTIKSYNINYAQYNRDLNEARAGRDHGNLPMINIIDLNLTKEGLNRLYGCHHVFIKNANREGWSLPLWEAMSAGCKVIHSDLPVFSDVDPRFTRSFTLGSVEGLTTALLDEFRHWKKFKGYINNYSWNKCAERVDAVLKKT